MFPKKDPSKGQEKTPTWSLENWKERKNAAGWLQLPPVWMETHHYFVTVPCHSFLTQGKLECPWCRKCRPVEDSAYVAWVDESGKPFASSFKKYARPILAKIRPNDPILLGKGGDKFSPVWVKPRDRSYTWVPSPGTERTVEQFERWLLRVWKSPELMEFFAVDKPLSPAPAATDVLPINATAGTEERRERLRLQYQNWLAGKTGRMADSELAEIADVIPLLEAIARPGSNGRDKK